MAANGVLKDALEASENALAKANADFCRASLEAAEDIARVVSP